MLINNGYASLDGKKDPIISITNTNSNENAMSRCVAKADEAHVIDANSQLKYYIYKLPVSTDSSLLTLLHFRTFQR
jgi:hypothetical protein